MVTVPEHYTPYLDDGAVAATTLVAYLSPVLARPDLHDVRERILAHPRTERVTEISAPFDATESDPPPDGPRGDIERTEPDEGSFRFICGTGDYALDCLIQLERSDQPEFEAGRYGLTQEDVDLTMRSEWCVSLTTHLGEHVLADYHSALKLINAAAPGAVTVFDHGALRPHSAVWVREAAAARVPPPPDNLYTVHAVRGDDEFVWFHSHGLTRCGCLELEMLQIPGDATGSFGYLFNVTASLWIERTTPPAGELFEAGQGIDLQWLPWEEGIAHFPKDAVGGTEDRDEDHSGPSGILFAAGDETPPKNVTVFAEQLDDEPVLFLTHMETQRMSLMAKDAFPRFRRLQKRFCDHEGWSFHVKLGYQIDDCPDDEDDNEHLWFDVLEIHGGEVVATLLNQPYCIARMNEGDTDRHAVDQLSDWSIDSPHGVFDASTIGRLEEFLAMD